MSIFSRYKQSKEIYKDMKNAMRYEVDDFRPATVEITTNSAYGTSTYRMVIRNLELDLDRIKIHKGSDIHSNFSIKVTDKNKRIIYTRDNIKGLPLSLDNHYKQVKIDVMRCR